jgi:hypothetical protein
MERNDILIGGKASGYSGQVSALQASGRREARAIVNAGGANEGQFREAARRGFAGAAQRRTAQAANIAARRARGDRGGRLGD